jgi:hypothetical protein
VTLAGARVHQIRRIENKVLVALVRDTHSNHFPADCVPKNIMDVEAAKRVWNADPRFLTQSGAAADAGGAAADGDDVNGVPEGDIPDVENFIGEVDASARESHDAEKSDMKKRHEVALMMRGEMIVCVERSGGAPMFYLVSGEWCTASRTVPLHIVGFVSGKSKFRGVDIDCINAYPKQDQGNGIWPATFGRVTALEFEAMLVENRQFPPSVRQNFIIDLFRDAPLTANARQQQPAAVVARSEAPVQSSRFALNSRAGGAQQLQAALARGAEAREREYAAALERELPHATLLARICSMGKSPPKMLRAPFAELSLRLMMINEYLVFVRDYYNGDVALALSLVARGESSPVAAGSATDAAATCIPTPGPPASELRAIDAQCRNECIAIVYRMLRDEPHVLCFRPLRKRIGEERHQAWLALLPDLSLASYRRVIAPSVRCTPAPPMHIAVAVDIYHSIILADVHAPDGSGALQPGRDGHMFSVFGMHERELAETSYHQRGFRETPDTLRAPDTLGQHGAFVLPPDGTPLTPVQRLQLRNDRMRLACGESSASSDEFADALRWLVDQRIVVRERHVGTGTYNSGKPFDTFQSVDLHEEQTALVDLLVDIYRRGVEQRTLNSQRLTTPAPADLYAHFAELAAARAAWSRQYIPAVIESRAKRIAFKLQAASSSVASAVQPGDSQAPERAQGELLRALALEVARYDAVARERYRAIGGPAHDGSERDPYADARAGREHRVPGLLLGARPPPVLANGKPLAPEQLECVRRIMEQAIVQPVGRGGVGKSEMARYLALCYPQQIVFTAFTGNATSELTRRTGVKASTIHSLLFRHTRFREARIRTAAYRKHADNKRKREGAAVAPLARKLIEHFTLEDVRACNDDYVLRSYVEEHVGGVPPLLSPFPLGGSVLVIDEMSLVSFKLFYHLLRAAHCPAEGRYIAKLVLMGDLDQLPSVDFGNVQSDIAHGFPDSVHELVTNHRSEGTELFGLAQAIAEHRQHLPLPQFDICAASAALTNGAGPAPLIAFDCAEGQVESRINYVYDKLGAYELPRADGERPRLRAIQTIATTNPEIDTANETIRQSLFGARVSGQPAQAVRMIQRADACNDEGVDAQLRALEEERALLATRVFVGDRIFMTRNQRIVYPPTSRDPEQREKLFFNSRLLEAVQFYNAPAKIMPTTWCRCHLCPAKQEGAPDDYVGPCIERRDLVPPERRGIDLSTAVPITYHAENLQNLGPSVCRMGVFRDQSGDFVEFNVTRMLGQSAVPARNGGGYAPYARGFAMTVHKMQGAQQRTIVYLCSRSSKNFGWRAVYTAVTRAQCNLVILSTDERFREFVYRLEPIRRSSLWYHLSKAVDSICNKPTDRSIAARWSEFERSRYRTDTPPPPPQAVATPAQLRRPVDDVEQLHEDDEEDDGQSAVHHLIKRARK